MALRVSTIHGLSSTYLESVHASSGDTSPSPVSMMYRRTGNPSAPVECVTSDGVGLYERAMIEMRHDCLSCLVREHTYEALRRLDDRGLWKDAIVTFPPGVDPSAFAQLVAVFQEDDAPGFTLTVDTSIAVVDSLLFLAQIADSQLMREWSLDVVPGDERSVGEVLARQIEFADVVLLANEHRLSDVQSSATHELIQHLNPAAALVRMDEYGRPARLCIARGLFDLDHPRRANPLTSKHRPCASTGTHFTSMTWTRDRPMHPQRFSELINDGLPNVVRSRGQLWFATTPTNQVGWESVGQRCTLAALDPWHLVSTGAENFLLLVGPGLDLQQTTEALDRTLLTQDEMSFSLDAWEKLPNPFDEALRAPWNKEIT
jgi:G3E family GTPase